MSLLIKSGLLYLLCLSVVETIVGIYGQLSCFPSIWLFVSGLTTLLSVVVFINLYSIYKEKPNECATYLAYFILYTLLITNAIIKSISLWNKEDYCNELVNIVFYISTISNLVYIGSIFIYYFLVLVCYLN